MREELLKPDRLIRTPAVREQLKLTKGPKGRRPSSARLHRIRSGVQLRIVRWFEEYVCLFECRANGSDECGEMVIRCGDLKVEASDSRSGEIEGRGVGVESCVLVLHPVVELQVSKGGKDEGVEVAE